MPRIARFAPVIGKALSHYRILEKIGAGGMGEVYRAHDEQLDRDVAIKVLPTSSFSDPGARARLLREARSAGSLNHPHICTMHEVGEAEGQAFIVMELVEGQSLSARLARGALPAEEVLRYGLQLADALGHAHERGIVHRDLKSANVVITPEGRAKVLDFGLAKRLREEELEEATRSQASFTAAGALVGTLAYMAPEQLRGQPADARSDVWALGVVLYEMAAGARPFQGQTGFELSSAILNQRPAPLAGKVPIELRAVIDRCLEKKPAQRYQWGGEVQAALEAVQTGAVAPWVAWRYRLARRRWLAVVGAVVVLAAVLVGLNVGRVRERLLTLVGARHGVPLPKIESIAVLPLENLSGDKEQDYFADGMTEALITNLAKIKTLKVISRTSAMRYKGIKKPLPEIAKDLDVDAIIAGSMQRSGSRVRISAQLIRASSDQVLWAENYERDLQDVLVLQSEVARAIVQEINVAVTPGETKRLSGARPINPEAYEAYLKGRFHWYRFTPEDFDAAMKYFQLALEKDPQYALAYVGLSATWAAREHVLGDISPQEALPKWKAAALKAVELDDSLAEAHELLATVRESEWDWSGAEREFRRAIELNPRCTDWRVMHFEFLTVTKRLEESNAEIRRCVESDPLNSFYQRFLGFNLINLRRYDDGIAQAQKVLRMDPTLPAVHGDLFIAFFNKGMYAEALAEEIKLLKLQSDNELAVALARGNEQGGYPAAMRRAAETLVGRSKRTYVQPTMIADFYVRAADKDRALEWFEKAFQVHDTQLFYLNVLPQLDALRSDPRFQDLLRRMNFPK